MILDIIFIGVMLICLVIGMKKGFIRAVFGVASFVLSIVAVYFLYRPFMDYINSNSFLNSIVININEAISKSIAPFIKANIGVDSVTSSMPTFITRSIFKPELIQQGVDNVVSSAATLITNIILVIIFLIAVKIAINILLLIIGIIVKLPIVKQCNSIMGAGFGLINGILLCYILAAIISLLSMNEKYIWIINEMNSSYVASYFYKNNLILNILVGFNVVSKTF